MYSISTEQMYSTAVNSVGKPLSPPWPGPWGKDLQNWSYRQTLDDIFERLDLAIPETINITGLA